MDKNTILFESFNDAINAYFALHEAENERKADQFARSGLQGEFVDYIAQTVSQVQTVAKEWEDTPVEGLGGITPKEYIDSLDDFESILSAFKKGAIISDVELPYPFLEKLRSFSNDAAAALISLACDNTLIESSDEASAIPVAAIRVLGMWNSTEAVGPLLILLHQLSSDRELVFETITEALAEILKAQSGKDSPALMQVVDELNRADSIGTVEEYLFSALSKAGPEVKSDMVYKCLKNAFLKMPDKGLGALFMADYGDGRIIPALRGYVEKNLKTIDKDTYYDIKYAVEKLGGSLD